MAVKRKIRKGLATNVLCVLRNEGGAPPGWLARRFDHSESTVQRTLDSLERQGAIRLSTVMSAGNYYLTDRGYSVLARSRNVCPTPKRFAVTRAYSDRLYVPIGRAGARRRRRR